MATICSELVIISSILIGTVLAGEYCTVYEDGNYYYKWCDYGCCDSNYDHGAYSEKCCSMSTAIIVGSIIAGLFVIGGIVVLIIFCVYCHKTKGSRSRGNIINPAPTQQQTVIYHTAVPQPPPYPGVSGQPYPQQPGQHPYPQQQPYQQNMYSHKPAEYTPPPQPMDPAYPPSAPTYPS